MSAVKLNCFIKRENKDFSRALISQHGCKILRLKDHIYYHQEKMCRGGCVCDLHDITVTFQCDMCGVRYADVLTDSSV